ncbi:MAG: amidohydrolase family protein, partial [Armatimonadota bacterium]
ARACDRRRFFGLAVVSPDDAERDVRRWIEDLGLIGFKPYHSLVTRPTRPEVGIPDMLPEAQMRVADDRRLIVMLHIPRHARLADPRNKREIAALAEAYPNAAIVLAHIGRAYYLKCVIGHLEEVREHPNVYIDLAMLNHWEVLEHAFREFPRDRIIFGSDMPISGLGGKSVEINDQYAYILEDDVSIGASIYDADHAVTFTYFYYEELRAIRKAAQRARLSRRELEAIFFDNAMRLIRRAAEAECANIVAKKGQSLFRARIHRGPREVNW